MVPGDQDIAAKRCGAAFEKLAFGPFWVGRCRRIGALASLRVTHEQNPTFSDVENDDEAVLIRGAHARAWVRVEEGHSRALAQDDGRADDDMVRVGDHNVFGWLVPTGANGLRDMGDMRASESVRVVIGNVLVSDRAQEGVVLAVLVVAPGVPDAFDLIAHQNVGEERDMVFMGVAKNYMIEDRQIGRTWRM